MPVPIVLPANGRLWRNSSAIAPKSRVFSRTHSIRVFMSSHLHKSASVRSQRQAYHGMTSGEAPQNRQPELLVNLVHADRPAALPERASEMVDWEPERPSCMPRRSRKQKANPGWADRMPGNAGWSSCPPCLARPKEGCRGVTAAFGEGAGAISAAPMIADAPRRHVACLAVTRVRADEIVHPQIRRRERPRS